MRWIEATIETSSGEIDTLCEALEHFGVQGVSIEDEEDLRQFLEHNRQYWDYIDDSLTKRYAGVSRVKFYLIDDETGRQMLENIRNNLRREIRISYVNDEDWEYTWRQNYTPIEIGKRLMVVPDWLEPELGGRIALRLEPGLAFGTGSHATTRMCLEALDALDLKGKKVLDLGCGSGILGIGALVLGCERVTGCDVDPNAMTAVRTNAALNGIDESRLLVRSGNILTDEGLRKALGSGFDVVTANIVADVVLPLTGFARRFLAEGGIYICSGIIDERAAEVKRELSRNGFEVLRHLELEEWHCFVSR